jgi:hypothetical protein
MEHLRTKLTALYYDIVHLYMYCSKSLPRKSSLIDCKRSRIQYDGALDILRDDVAWEYDGIIDSMPDFIKVGSYI